MGINDIRHMKNLIIAIFVVLIIPEMAFAFQCDTPIKTAKAYIQYDLEGARLGSNVSANIDKLETDNKYESAWDIATLVTGYEIKSIKPKGGKAIITILFRNAWETSTSFKAEAIKDEIVKMHLIREKSCWRVGPPFYQPHLYSDFLIKHLEKLIKSDADTAAKDWLEYTQSELNSIRKYQKARKNRGNRD